MTSLKEECMVQADSIFHITTLIEPLAFLSFNNEINIKQINNLYFINFIIKNVW